MAALDRPSVQVLQVVESSSPTILTPTLLPAIVGPAYEIVKALKSDGTIDSDAKANGPYQQFLLDIPQASFPAPRENLDEVDILEAETKAFLKVNGVLREVSKTSAFLAQFGVTRVGRAAMDSSVAADFDVVGKTLEVAFDSGSTHKITFVDAEGNNPGDNLTIQQMADQINDKVGSTVAMKGVDEAGAAINRLRLASTKWGAQSKVEIKDGTALAVLDFDQNAFVTGAGLFVDDDLDDDNFSSFIKYQRGEQKDINNDGQAVLLHADHTDSNPNVDEFAPGDGQLLADIDFIDLFKLEKGDLLYADGALIGAELLQVTANRLQVGAKDSSGNLVPADLRILTASNPFSPQFVWFQATGLTGTTNGTAAVLESEDFAAATAAKVTTQNTVNVSDDGGGLGTFESDTSDISIQVVLDGVSYGPITRSLGADVPNIPNAAQDGEADDVSLLAAQLDLLDWKFSGQANNDIKFGDDNGKLTIKTITQAGVDKTGANQSIKVIAADTDATYDFGNADDVVTPGTDPEQAGLDGTTLEFKLDSGTNLYKAKFTSDTLDDAVTAINNVAPGLASKNNLKLKLTSPIAGVSSKVDVTSDVDLGGDEWLFDADAGDGKVSAVGTGRPRADFAMLDTGEASLAGQIVREKQTGNPQPKKYDVYLQWRGLRQDISHSAKTPGLLRIGTTEDLDTLLGPVSADNPLALAVSQALLNAPSIEVAALGVDAVVAGTADGGTLASHTSAAEFLEGYDVYAICPLTEDPDIHSMWSAHATSMAKAENRGERIIIQAPAFPDRKVDDLLGSGTKGNTTVNDNELVVENAVADDIADLGLNPGALTVADDVFLKVTVTGTVRKYSVVSVVGDLITVRDSFGAGENTDGFYSTATLSEALTDTTWSVNRRGVAITQNSDIAETAGKQGEAIKSRRVFSVFAKNVGINIDGIENELDPFYYAAAVAGMCGEHPPQQGFTNFPVAGFTRVTGTNDRFSESQLDTIAGGGRWIPIQEVQGGPLVARHQLSTDLASVETREMSITRVVDYTAKLLRVGLRKFIGLHNITGAMLDQLSAALHAQLHFLQEGGVLLGAEISRVEQDSTQPDKIIVDVILSVPYPANYIKLTLVV